MAKPVKSKKQRAPNKAAGEKSAPELEIAPPGRPAFSGWPMIIGWLAMLIFTGHACTHMVAAGDTWVAMACGRHFVNHGVDTVEPFSANSHRAGPTEDEIKRWPRWAQWITDKVGIETVKRWHPTGWINQNWLTHVIFYSLVPKSSYADGVSFTSNALVYWKFAIYIVTVVCVYYTGRLLGANPALCAVFSCFAMFTGRSFLDIRPAGFSNMLVAVFLLVLVLATYRNILYIWLVVPVTVFWCNVHGGYIYVFIMLAPLFVLHLLTALPRKWTVSVGSIFLWMGLYALAYKFRSGLDTKMYELSLRYSVAPVPPYADKLFYLIGILAIASIVIAAQKRVKQGAFYSYHIAVSIILMLTLLIARFFPEVPASLPKVQRDVLVRYVTGNQVGFLVAFVILTALVVITGFSKEKLVSIGLKGLCHVAGAGVAAFAASIVFNPFHLTNLTHTFVISVSRHAARWRDIHEWHGAFDWSNPVGTAVPFLVMFIIALTALVLWGAMHAVRPRSVGRQKKRRTRAAGGCQWPKIDLAIVIIAFLTIYMAIRSRRFIPIAAVAACPVIAMLIDQTIRSMSAVRNFQIRQRLVVPPMPQDLQMGLTIAGAVTVLFFGTWWGLKFKRIYLDAWPSDPKLSSVFMRMTASDAKPFYAMKFIKDNKLKGNMFNYWTEGGFIAWGQEPDPNTGRTPLQLFMDGRAQAAYDRATFDAWTMIVAGGEVTLQTLARIQARGGEMTADDYKLIGDWMDKQMKAPENNAWVYMMPGVVFGGSRHSGSYHAMRALENHPDWRLVFLNNRQKVLVDISTPQGKKLFEGIFTGETIYPDEYHTNLIRSHCWVLYRPGLAEKREGFEFAKKAFELNPSPTPLFEVLAYAALPQLKSEVDAFCSAYLDEFDANRNTWYKQDGYRPKTQAVQIMSAHLKDPARREQYLDEVREIDGTKRW